LIESDSLGQLTIPHPLARGRIGVATLITADSVEQHTPAKIRQLLHDGHQSPLQALVAAGSGDNATTVGLPRLSLPILAKAGSQLAGRIS
jgi:hypothetical protein